MGGGAFRIVYSLISLITFGGMIYYYHAIGREPTLWNAGDAGWIVGTILMWLAAILFVGSFIGNPALVGRLDRAADRKASSPSPATR